jgi:molybdopterin-guanine dinucleotide biosynthesis protein A
LTGLLLVGGLSSRMGRDKATLMLNGQPLWKRQIQVLRSLQPVALLISAREMPAWAPADVQVVLDTPPSRGPLSGLAAALNYISTSHLLALAVDMPRLSVEHLRRLLDLAHPGRGVVPFNQDHFEPLSAIYCKEATPLAQKSLASDNVSLHSFVRKLKRRDLLFEYCVPAEEQSHYYNLNTPEDVTL